MAITRIYNKLQSIYNQLAITRIYNQLQSITIHLQSFTIHLQPITINYKDLHSITIHLQSFTIDLQLTKMAITRIYNQLQSIYNRLKWQLQGFTIIYNQ